MYAKDVPAGQIFYHGTKADLAVGDLIRPGFGSNFVERELKHIYFTATLDAAAWGAELARGDGRGRIYIVGPTGAFEDDPNLTDKKFPGNMAVSPSNLAESVGGLLSSSRSKARGCARPARPQRRRRSQRRKYRSVRLGQRV